MASQQPDEREGEILYPEHEKIWKQGQCYDFLKAFVIFAGNRADVSRPALDQLLLEYFGVDADRFAREHTSLGESPISWMGLHAKPTTPTPQGGT